MDSEYPTGTLTNHADTEAAIKECQDCKSGEIHTTQIHHATTDRLMDGFRLYVHFSVGDFTEIVLGDGNERTEKQIRYAHNLPRMILAGAFQNAPTRLDNQHKPYNPL